MLCSTSRNVLFIYKVGRIRKKVVSHDEEFRSGSPELTCKNANLIGKGVSSSKTSNSQTFDVYVARVVIWVILQPLRVNIRNTVWHEIFARSNFCDFCGFFRDPQK